MEFVALLLLCGWVGCVAVKLVIAVWVIVVGVGIAPCCGNEGMLFVGWLRVCWGGEGGNSVGAW